MFRFSFSIIKVICRDELFCVLTKWGSDLLTFAYAFFEDGRRNRPSETSKNQYKVFSNNSLLFTLPETRLA